MKNVNLSIVAIVFVVIAALAFVALGGFVGYHIGVRSCPECPQVASDTVYLPDTSSYGTHGDSIPEEVTKDSLVPFPVPVPYPVTKDSIVHDATYVFLPMEWKHAFIKDTCDIYYHGIMAGIDSLKFYFQNTVITNNILQTEYKQPMLTFDAGVGALYHQEKINPYLVGVLRYNRPKTTFGVFGAVNHEGDWCAGVNVTYRMTIFK